MFATTKLRKSDRTLSFHDLPEDAQVTLQRLCRRRKLAVLAIYQTTTHWAGPDRGPLRVILADGTRRWFYASNGRWLYS